jgi:hypothetical protein
MKTSLILILICCLFAVGAVVGCGGDDEESLVKTMDEYRQEAAEEITAENAEAVLDEMEAELEEDTP